MCECVYKTSKIVTQETENVEMLFKQLQTIISQTKCSEQISQSEQTN